jgi:hypothetical protein
MKKILLHVFVLTLLVVAQKWSINACECALSGDDIEMNDCGMFAIDEDASQHVSFKTIDFEFPLLNTAFNIRYSNGVPNAYSKRMPAQAFISIISPPPDFV